MTDERDRAPQHWVNSQVERKLAELSQQVDQIWRELREEIRRGDNRQSITSYIDERMKELKLRVDGMADTIRDDLMSRDDFRPYRNGFIAVMTTVGMAVLGALLKVVILQK